MPVEATLRAAMDDIGWGFWRLLVIGAVGFAPLWALVLLLGDNPLSTIIQFLALVPSAALLAGAGTVRVGRRPGIGAAYRQAAARLLHYVLANLVVGVIVFLLVLVPSVVVVIAIVMASLGSPDSGPVAAVVVLAAIAAVVPIAFVSTRLSLVGPLVVIEGLDVGDAIAEGWRRTRRQVLRLIVVFIVGSIPGLLVVAGATMLAFGLLTLPVAAGLVFGLGYSAAILVVTCVNVVAWQRLGGDAAAPEVGATSSASEQSLVVATPTSPASPLARPDRGPLTAVVLLVVGLTLVIAGSAAAVGKVGGWVHALSGQADGTVSYGLNGIGCFQPDKQMAFEAGDVIHLVADLTLAVPAGERLAYEVYADGELVDRGFEEPFAQETECFYLDLDTTDIAPGDYTFRYLWAADVVAEGTFTITP